MHTSIRGLLSLLLLSCSTPILASDHRFERNYEEDKVIDNLSFGQRGTTWADDHRSIKGWDVTGDGYTPELYSDRIIVTPPWPGSRRGALWAQNAEVEPEWEASFEFRVNGPEKGNGNMQFWYVRNASTDIGTSSIYTVGKFDGVAIVVSQAGEKSGIGTVRAFLNDGTINFNSHYKVDDLAFGQCDYSYRNLGVFSKITVEQTYWTFKVLVDGQKCISTYSVSYKHTLLCDENYELIVIIDSSATQLPLRHHSPKCRTTRFIRSQVLCGAHHQRRQESGARPRHQLQARLARV
jgi:mannose-binding lectin 1